MAALASRARPPSPPDRLRRISSEGLSEHIQRHQCSMPARLPSSGFRSSVGLRLPAPMTTESATSRQSVRIRHRVPSSDPLESKGARLYSLSPSRSVRASLGRIGAESRRASPADGRRRPARPAATLSRFGDDRHLPPQFGRKRIAVVPHRTARRRRRRRRATRSPARAQVPRPSASGFADQSANGSSEGSWECGMTCPPSEGVT